MSYKIPIFLMVVLILSTTTCTTSTNQEIIAFKQQFADWKLVTPTTGRINEPFVEFHIPPDFVEKNDGRDYMGESPKFYGNENVWLVFTIQLSSQNDDIYSNQNDFQSEKIIIDGKQGVISTFTGTEMVNDAKDKKYVATLSVPEIQGKTNNLLMWAYSKIPEDRENVKKIFRSVRFSNK